MRKLLPWVFCLALPVSSPATPKLLELPPETFSTARLGLLNVKETPARFAEIWFQLKQQYDLRDGTFVRKDGGGKTLMRFPLEVFVVSKLGEKKWYCTVEGAAPKNVIVETAGAEDLPQGKRVSVWAEPAGAEKFREVAYPKFREWQQPGDQKKLPVPSEAELQKAFLADLAAGKTFEVEVIEQRTCPTCSGSGRVPVKPDPLKPTLATQFQPCPDSDGTGKRPAKILIRVTK